MTDQNNPYQPPQVGPPADPAQPPYGQPAAPPPAQPQYGQPYPPAGQPPVAPPPPAQPSYGQPYGTPPQYGQSVPPAQPPYGYGQPQATVSDLALGHWLTILGILGTLIAFLMKKNIPGAREEAAKALNWTIPIQLLMFVIAMAQNIVSPVRVLANFEIVRSNTAAYYGFSLIWWALLIVMIFFGVKNAKRVKRGEPTSYPLEVNWIK